MTLPLATRITEYFDAFVSDTSPGAMSIRCGLEGVQRVQRVVEDARSTASGLEAKAAIETLREAAKTLALGEEMAAADADAQAHYAAVFAPYRAFAEELLAIAESSR